MNVQQEIQRLSRALNDLALATGPRKRTRRRKRGNATSVQAAPAAMGSAQRPRMRLGSGRQREGEVTVDRRELLTEVTASASTTSSNGVKYLNPDTTNPSAQFPWLSTLAKMFDRMRVNHMRIYWVPAVGTNTSGQLYYGIDWNRSAAKGTAAVVTAMTPSMQISLWMDTTNKPMVLPRDRLQTLLWYQIGGGSTYQFGPGNIVWYATYDSPSANKVLGAFWVDYSVTLQGTSAT